MPTRHGQTGWRHRDEKIQKEFERIARQTDATIKSALDDPARGLSPTTAATSKIRSVSHNDVVKVQDVTMLDFQDTPSEGMVIPTFYEIYGSANYGKVKTFAKMPIRTGTITIDLLPDNSLTYHERDTWKRYNAYVRPDVPYNWYGWAVYNYIDHGWKLNNPNDFILQLVDIDETTVGETEDELDIENVYNYVVGELSEVELEDETLVAQAVWDYYNKWSEENPVSPYGAFEPKKDNLMVDGIRIKELVVVDDVEYEIEKDIVLLRGLHKPDLPFNYNDSYTGRLDYINEAERRVRTNLTFRYTLLKGS